MALREARLTTPYIVDVKQTLKFLTKLENYYTQQKETHHTFISHTHSLHSNYETV